MNDNTYEGRAARGVALAADADRPEVVIEILELLRDPDDTFVILSTAEALLQRRDTAGLRLVVQAEAWGEATSDWDIRDTVGDAFSNRRADTLGADDEFFREGLEELAAESDPGLASAAVGLLNWMGLRR